MENGIYADTDEFPVMGTGCKEYNKSLSVYIWNTEYEVLFAIAKNVDKAREMILLESLSNKALLEDIDKRMSGKSTTDPIWDEWRALRSTGRDHIHGPYDKEDQEQLQGEPTFIFPVNSPMAYIYSHANE